MDELAEAVPNEIGLGKSTGQECQLHRVGVLESQKRVESQSKEKRQQQRGADQNEEDELEELDEGLVALGLIENGPIAACEQVVNGIWLWEQQTLIVQKSKVKECVLDILFISEMNFEMVVVDIACSCNYFPLWFKITNGFSAIELWKLRHCRWEFIHKCDLVPAGFIGTQIMQIDVNVPDAVGHPIWDTAHKPRLILTAVRTAIMVDCVIVIADLFCQNDPIPANWDALVVLVHLIARHALALVLALQGEFLHWVALDADDLPILMQSQWAAIDVGAHAACQMGILGTLWADILTLAMSAQPMGVLQAAETHVGWSRQIVAMGAAGAMILIHTLCAFLLGDVHAGVAHAISKPIVLLTLCAHYIGVALCAVAACQLWTIVAECAHQAIELRADSAHTLIRALQAGISSQIGAEHTLEEV